MSLGLSCEVFNGLRTIDKDIRDSKRRGDVDRFGNYTALKELNEIGSELSVARIFGSPFFVCHSELLSPLVGRVRREIGLAQTGRVRNGSAPSGCTMESQSRQTDSLPFFRKKA